MIENFLRPNETIEHFFFRCYNLTLFDCSEDEMLWWQMGSRRLPLKGIIPISVVLLVIFISGIVGNACVCVVIVRQPGLHTATNYYLFSLAVSDILLLLFGVPNDLSVYWHQYPYTFGIVFCKLRALISEAATYVSVLTISAFSLERYLAICHPLHLYAMSGLTRATRIIILVWVSSVICAIPFAVYSDIKYIEYPPGSGNISLESAFCTLTTASPLLELSSVFFFFVPSVLILYLYVRMGLHIRSSRATEESKIGRLRGLIGHVHEETRQSRSRKIIIRMLAAVVIAFFVCWTPFHVQRLFYIYGDSLLQFHAINEHLFNVAGVLYYVSATVNPVLYNVMSGRYRLAFRETLLCRKNPKISNLDHTSCREVTTFPSFASSSTRVQDKKELRCNNSRVESSKKTETPCCERLQNGNAVFYFQIDNEARVQIQYE